VPRERRKFKKASKNDSGEIRIEDIPWQLTKYNKDLDLLLPKTTAGIDLSVPFARELNAISDNSHIKQMGDVKPIFLSEAVLDKFKFIKVSSSEEVRKKFDMAANENPPIYAALYRYKNKNILLVRQATYSPSDFSSEVYLKAYMALLSEFEDVADVLVLDQTHNPGGNYCSEFYNIFAHDGDVQGVELLHADRKWINDLKVNYILKNPKPKVWEALTLEAWGVIVEQAYDTGHQLSEPIPLFSGSFFANRPDKNSYRWSKPILLLIDELAGSCGDMFPMLVKANHRAKIFGQRTMGLGGNVENVGILNNSRIHVSMTRGLFYPYNPTRGPLESEFIENNGVTPDTLYTHTIEDFRAGFINYVKSFSDQAAAL